AHVFGRRDDGTCGGAAIPLEGNRLGGSGLDAVGRRAAVLVAALQHAACARHAGGPEDVPAQVGVVVLSADVFEEEAGEHDSVGGIGGEYARRAVALDP